MELCKNIVAISLEDTGSRWIGLAIIHIDCIELSGYGQGTIGSDGLVDCCMALLLREFRDIMVAIFGQEALSECSNSIFLSFIRFTCSYCHSNGSM